MLTHDFSTSLASAIFPASKMSRPRQNTGKGLGWLARVAFALAAAAVADAAAQAADPYADAAHYRLGDPNAPLLAIEAEIRGANVQQLRTIEARLVHILQTPDATSEARSWAGRTLRLAGSEQSVPALAAMLTDTQSAADAQFALRSIGSPKVDAALRDALPKTRGLLQVGVIQALGARRDPQAVQLIAPLASDADPVVAEAALYALGQIGGEEALRAAQKAKVPEPLERARQHAVLLGAESLSAAGRPAEAGRAYGDLYALSKDVVIKSAALRGLVAAEQAKAAPTLIEALRSADPRLSAAAAKALAEVANDELVNALLSQFAAWTPQVQALVLGTIDTPLARPTCVVAASSPDERVRLAAISALGRLGSAANIPLLLDMAVQSGAGQAVARKSLAALRDQAANEALIAAARSGATPIRVEAIRALAARNATGAVPVFIALAAEGDPAVRAAAFKGIGQMGRAADLASLVTLVVQSQTASDRDAAEGALSAVAQRAVDREAAAAPVLAALPGASTEARCALLRVLSQLPGPKSLDALRAAIRSGDAAVQDVAVRGLAEWPDATALSDLGAIAGASNNPTHRALALRGFIRLAGLASGRPAADTVRLLADALKWSRSAEEKQLVLAALSACDDASALEVAGGCLADGAVEVEAATTVVRLARKLQATDPDAASAAVQRILDTCKSPAARQLAEGAGILLGGMVNIAPQGTATSPDDLDQDGEAGGDQAAIDGNPATYWDEADGAKLYRLVVTFKQAEKIAALSILGYAHQNYAPKDFEVLCDGRVVKKVEGAQYSDNLLAFAVPETTCQTVELKITGYYGNSPAIRELGLYRPAVRAPAAYRILVYSKTLGFRHANIPLGVAAIRQLGREHGFAVDATEDSAVFTTANLATYKAVVFLSVTGDVLNDAQQEVLKSYLVGGGGYVAIHGALFGPGACEEKWDWYGEVCCVAFKNHSAVVPARVDIEDATNPSTVGLPAQWPRTDEWYNYNGNPRGCARVLVTIDETTYQGGTLGADHPMTWCRQMGQGRVWYTAMGHTDESFREPLFLKHILGGIEQVVGVKTADFTPQPKPALK